MFHMTIYMYREIFVRLHVNYHDIYHGNQHLLETYIYIYIHVLIYIYISFARSFNILGNMFAGILGYTHIMCHVPYHIICYIIHGIHRMNCYSLHIRLYIHLWSGCAVVDGSSQSHDIMKNKRQPISHDSIDLVEYHVELKLKK